MPLAATIPSIEPSAHVWPRIEAGIGTSSGRLNAVRFWRGATSVSLALAAASLVVLILSKAPVTPPPAAPPLLRVLTSVIQPDSGKFGPIIAAVLDRTGGELILMNAQLDMAPGKSAELWVILAGQPAQSLGVIKEGQAQRLPLPAALTGAGQTTSLLAVLQRASHKAQWSPPVDLRTPRNENHTEDDLTARCREYRTRRRCKRRIKVGILKPNRDFWAQRHQGFSVPFARQVGSKTLVVEVLRSHPETSWSHQPPKSHRPTL